MLEQISYLGENNMAAALPFVAAATIGGSLFGRNKGGSPGGQSSSSASHQESGFNTLPPEVQNAYLNQYLPSIQQQFHTRYSAPPLGQAQGGPFGSQALQELQNYSNSTGGVFGNGTGVSPLGAVEPFNPYQQQAIQAFGGGLSGLQNELPGYQNLYNKNVLEPELANLEDQRQQALNAMRSNQLLRTGGLNAFSNSAFGTQLAGLEDIASKARLNARAGAFAGAQNLRRMTLQDMLNAGGAIQEQNQSLLNVLQPYLQQTTPGAMNQNFAQGLSAFPGSTISDSSSSGTVTNPTAGKPNLWARIGAAGQALGGFGQVAQGFGGFGGGGGFNAHAQPYTGGNQGVAGMTQSGQRYF